MFSMKLLLILISFCYEVHSKVFLNQKNIFCITNLVLMKKQTHGLHLLRGDFDEVRENERQIKK